jgi:hypothetical protein
MSFELLLMGYKSCSRPTDIFFAALCAFSAVLCVSGFFAFNKAHHNFLGELKSKTAKSRKEGAEGRGGNALMFSAYPKS